MNQKKAKSLRRLAVKYSNPNSRGLLHEGLIELFREDKKEKGPWMIRIFMRQYAKDSSMKLYRQFKKLYTRNMLPEYFLNRMA